VAQFLLFVQINKTHAVFIVFIQLIFLKNSNDHGDFKSVFRTSKHTKFDENDFFKPKVGLPNDAIVQL